MSSPSVMPQEAQHCIIISAASKFVLVVLLLCTEEDDKIVNTALVQTKTPEKNNTPNWLERSGWTPVCKKIALFTGRHPAGHPVAP